MLPRTLAPAVFCLLFSPAALSAIYQWTDASGAVHFSDQPPRPGSGQAAVPATAIELNAPSVVPMSDNLGQSRRVSATRRSVEGLLARPKGTGRTSAGPSREAQQATCDGYRKRLARIQSRLRAGYSVSQGNRLRQQRREASQAYSRECILN
ncbi:DUF4124 domain-containing protein [Marinobacter sp. C2H3]|uniref:DUF4124 domain-containing protein n=1 Tax=Marinobacter sp. C2H3 TaxID=3119003 RepID=UPI00300ECBF9